MYPCTFHFRHLRNRAGQFALQGAPIIQFLHEIGHAHRGPVEDLIPYPPSVGKALTGHFETQVMYLRVGH